MATVKNFGLAGVGADVQYGKGNGRVKYDTDHFTVRNTADDDYLELYVKTPTGSSNAQAAVTKEYADSIAAGLDPKESVICATTETLTATFGTIPAEAGTGVGHTLTNADAAQLVFTIDGITPTIDQRVLIKDEAAQENNGIYTITTLGVDATTDWVLTRATDFDGTPTNEVSGGAFTFIESGTVYADTGWVVSSPTGNATMETTDIVWTQFSSAGIITVSGTGSRITVTPSGNDYQVDIHASYVGQSSITTLGTITTGTWTSTDVGIAYGGTGQSSLDDVTDAGSSRITITGGTGVLIGGATDMTIDVNEGSLDLDAIGGSLGLTDQVTGILPVDNGGTGASSLTDHGVLLGSGTGPITPTAVGATGTLLRGVSGADPAFSTLTMPDTIGARGIFIADAANTLLAIQATDAAGNQLLEWNDSSDTFGFVTSDSIGGFKFKTWETDGSSIVADAVEDTAKLAGGAGLTTSASADVITVDMDTSGLTDLGATLDAAVDLFFVDDGATGSVIKTVTAQDIVDAATINVFTSITGDTGSATVSEETDSLNFTGAEGIITTASDVGNVADVDIALALWEINTATPIGGDSLVFDDGGATNGKVTIDTFISTFEIVVDGDFGSQGMMSSNGSGTYTMRTFAVDGAGNKEGLTIANADSSGNPTYGLDIIGNTAHPDGSIAADDDMILYDLSTTSNRRVSAQELADSLILLAQPDQIISTDGFNIAKANDAGTITIAPETAAGALASNPLATFENTVDDIMFNFTNATGEITIEAGDDGGFGSSSTGDVDIRFVPGSNGEVIFGAAGTDATISASSGSDGENMIILGGDGTAGDGGDITLTPGDGSSGTDGDVCITDADSVSVMCFEGASGTTAVSYITLTNAPTGGVAGATAPEFKVVSTDTNVDIGFLPLGTGVLSVSGTTNYEANVVSGDDDVIPNKRYVTDRDAEVLSGSTSSFKFTVPLNADANTDPATSEVPAGATVMRVYMDVTAVDSTATLTVGTDAGGAEYAAASTNDPASAGLYVADLFSATVGDLRAVVASSGGTPVASAVVGDVAGTGYTTGDTVELLGGTTGAGGAATFTVTAAAGLITGLALLSAGGYSVDPSLDENVLTVLTGGGDGFATADVTMGTAGSADVIVEYKNA